MDNILKALGYKEQCIKIVLSGATTIKYLVLVNGKSKEKFTPTRGLRQGDPLSPYLFLFCAEGLNSMIKKADKNGEIQGVAMSTGNLYVSHLLFADDGILFYRTTPEEWV